jgi:hypothetical protein
MANCCTGSGVAVALGFAPLPPLPSSLTAEYPLFWKSLLGGDAGGGTSTLLAYVPLFNSSRTWLQGFLAPPFSAQNCDFGDFEQSYE